MAKTDDKVMSMVEKEIKSDSDVTVEELYEKAKKVNSGIGKLSLRQFNARYPLQVKRRMSPKGSRKRGTKKKARKDGGSRDAIRSVLLELARDVASAEGKGDLVDLVANVDRYVDKVEKATSG